MGNGCVVGFQKKSRQPDEEVETGEVTSAMGLGAGEGGKGVAAAIEAVEVAVYSFGCSVHCTVYSDASIAELGIVKEL